MSRFRIQKPHARGKPMVSSRTISSSSGNLVGLAIGLALLLASSLYPSGALASPRKAITTFLGDEFCCCFPATTSGDNPNCNTDCNPDQICGGIAYETYTSGGCFATFDEVSCTPFQNTLNLHQFVCRGPVDCFPPDPPKKTCYSIFWEGSNPMSVQVQDCTGSGCGTLYSTPCPP